MARRSQRISSRNSSTPQPIKRVSLSHDARAPRTVPAKLASLKEMDDIPGSFPESPREETPSKRACTPRRAAAVVPPTEEMHPQAHHKTTAEKHDDARWLGFSNKAAQSMQTKTSIPRLQMTPSKANGTPKSLSAPVFEFTFQREQSLDLSPAAKRMMEEKREEANRVKEQMKLDTRSEDTCLRPIATPKSQRGRFSDAHKQQFQKMDSIAGHASSYRKGPVRLAGATPSSVKSLKRSPSKAELDVSSAKSLKRSPAKAELDTPSKQNRPAPSSPLKSDDQPRKRARCDTEGVSPAKPLQQTSRLPLPSTPSKSGGQTPSKQTALLAQSPTRASIFGTTPTASLLSRTPIKPHVRIEESKPLSQPPSAAQLQERFNLLRTTPIKSILRTPQRLYSDDPAKVAAGTHFATPPQVAAFKLRAPATAPVRKHVDFSSSTKAREASKKASVTFTAGGPSSLAPITYPSLEAPTTSPLRRQSAGPHDFTFRAGHEIVFGLATSPSAKASPAGFTIRAVAEEPEQVPAASGSKKRKMEYENARSVQDAHPSPTVTLGSKKRKFDFENLEAEKDADVLEVDKENIAEERPAKRMKPTQSPAPVQRTIRAVSAPVEKKRTTLGVKPKAQVGKSTTKPAAKKAGTTISMARLNALAMPKKRA